MENCLVMQLKGSVENDSLLKLGEAKIEFLNVATGGTGHVSWDDFNASEDDIRVISGSITGKTAYIKSGVQVGWEFTCASNGTVIAVSNKYKVKEANIYNGQNVPHQIINAEDFIYNKAAFTRSKIVGDLTGLILAGFNQIMDFSEARGMLDLAEVTYFTIIEWGHDVGINISKNVLTGFVQCNGQPQSEHEDHKLDTSVSVPISRLSTASAPTTILLPYTNFTGNVIDISPKASMTGLNFEGAPNLTGTVESVAEAFAALNKTSACTLRVVGTQVKFGPSGSQVVPTNTLYFDFSDSSKVVVKNGNNSGAALATYTKASGTWSYAS